MMWRGVLGWAGCVLLLHAPGQSAVGGGAAQDHQATVELRARIAASPRLAFHAVRLDARPPRAGWKSGAVSGLAIDGRGTI